MFERSTLQLQLRKLLPVMVTVPALLLLVEAGFRKGDWFHDYSGWESPGLAKKMLEAEKFFQQEGRLDLVVLSTSVGRTWDVRQWEEGTSGTIRAYNFGYPDQRPERQYFLFKNLIHPEYKPDYVIYGISIPDCNSNVRGMHPDNPRQGAFWTYRAVSALSAKTLLDKGVAWLDENSFLFRSRHRARFSLQHGPIAMLPEDPTIGQGVIAPTIRRQAFGPMPVSWALHPDSIANKYNCYYDYWIPDDGEIGEVIKLGKYCQKHGIKFAVVEVPTSPYAHTNFNQDDAYFRFTNALDHIANQGIDVYPMARDLKLDNTYFEDQDHLNRWGGQIVTDYVYQRVLRQWFPETATAESLPEPEQIVLADHVTRYTGQIEIRSATPVTDEAQYAALRQVIIAPGTTAEIELTPDLAAGHYALELYGGDGSTTSPELTGQASLHLHAKTDDGVASVDMELEPWINTRIGVSYTQAYFTIKHSAALTLEVKNPSAEPVILDTAFLRSRLSAVGADGVIVD